MGGLNLKCLFLLMACAYTIAVPVDTSTEALVITSAATSEKESVPSKNVPAQITEMHIRANVSNRFCTTTVKSKVKNPDTKAKEIEFFIVLPDKAFISEFIMELDGKNYTAYVEEKEKAKKTYDQAVASGIGAAHVAARDSNKFSVSVNVEAESKCTFYLKYEELLERKGGKYELVININPKQLVPDMTAEVDIEEGRPLTSVTTPQIRSGNEITKESDDLITDAKITIDKPNSAHVVFSPTIEKQKQIARGLGKEEDEGLAGQFVVNYDVERDPSGGEVLVKDGYFVHFFAPAEQKPLKKHVVFVLDTSGSMWGTRIEQLKTAMNKILTDLQPDDFFSLVEFNSNVKVWNLNAPSESTYFPTTNDNWYNSDEEFPIEGVSFPPAYPVSEKTISKAKTAVDEMTATGGTNIFEALKVGLHLIKLRKDRSKKEAQPVIFFLTDGEPTVGKSDPKTIITGVSEMNALKTPIICLSFGTGADREFLEKVGLSNNAFARHIYEDADASLQLENFYQEVSSPLLSNIKFQYTPDTTSLTKEEFPIYYHGGEIVVAGKVPEETFEKNPPVIRCFGFPGPLIMNTTVTRSVGQLERLWAYMTVQKLLEDRKLKESEKEDLTKKALDLSLKYSFVTPVTSLVVVKPNATTSANAEAILEGQNYPIPQFAPPGGAIYASGKRKLAANSIGGFKSASLPATLPPRLGGGSLMIQSLAPGVPAFGFGFGGASGAAGPPPPPAPAGGAVYQSLATPLSYSPMVVSDLALSAIGPTDRFGDLETLSVDFDSDSMPPSYTTTINHQFTTIPTTTTTTVKPEPATLPPDVAPALKWLEKYLNTDYSLNFFKGSFKLGFNETITDEVDCTTLDSEEGLCKLIKDCVKVHEKITDERSFKDYFCDLKGFAGVCCPK